MERKRNDGRIVLHSIETDGAMGGVSVVALWMFFVRQVKRQGREFEKII